MQSTLIHPCIHVRVSWCSSPSSSAVRWWWDVHGRVGPPSEAQRKGENDSRETTTTRKGGADAGSVDRNDPLVCTLPLLFPVAAAPWLWLQMQRKLTRSVAMRIRRRILPTSSAMQLSRRLLCLSLLVCTLLSCCSPAQAAPSRSPRGAAGAGATVAARGATAESALRTVTSVRAAEACDVDLTAAGLCALTMRERARRECRYMAGGAACGGGGSGGATGSARRRRCASAEEAQE